MWFIVLNPWEVQWNFTQNASMFLKENTFEICLENVSHFIVLSYLINACFFPDRWEIQMYLHTIDILHNKW